MLCRNLNAFVFYEEFRIALGLVVDDEFAKEEPSRRLARITECAGVLSHVSQMLLSRDGTAGDVVRSDNRVEERVLDARVGAAGQVRTWRTLERSRLVADVCMTEQDPHYEHDQRLTGSNAGVLRI